MTARDKNSPTTKKTGGGKTISALLCNVLGILLILGVILLMLPSFLPRAVGIQVFNVVSGSMEPTIPVGSMIFVKPMEAKKIDSGDVIAFYSSGVVVTHRVVENRQLENRFVTKGDANDLEDRQKIEYRDLLGLVVYHVPVLGDVTAHLTTPLGKIYLFAVLVCGLLFNLIAGRLRDR